MATLQTTEQDNRTAGKGAGVAPAVQMQQAPPETDNFLAAENYLQAAAQRHEEEFRRERQTWDNAYNRVLESPVYKANPRAAELKNKEAALKTLVGAFAGLADMAGVAAGGTVSVRDIRPDVYASRKEAELADRQEKALEQESTKQKQDLIDKLLSRRPKYATNDPLLKLYQLHADRGKLNYTARQAMERLNLQQQFTAEENEKNRENARTVAGMRAANSNGLKQSDYVAITATNAPDDRYVLPKNLWSNGATLGQLTEIILKDPAVMGETEAVMKRINTMMGASNPTANMQYFIGQFVDRSPMLQEALRRYDTRYAAQAAEGSPIPVQAPTEAIDDYEFLNE